MAENVKTIQIGGLALHPQNGEAFREGQPLPLTKTEFRLLLLLASSDGSVLSRKEIIEAVQGSDYPVTVRSVDCHILELRKKLGEYARWIETVRGAGYRFRTE
jgi:DNA-binding response OmpR family regulator